MPKKEKFDTIDDYFIKDEDLILKNIKDDEAMLLSAYSLSNSKSKSIITEINPNFSERKIRSFAHRSLFSINPSPVISYYPLFGENIEAKWALKTENIVKCVLSLLEAKELYLNEKRMNSFFSSDEYATIFPSLDKTILLDLTKRIIKSLEELEILKKERKAFSLNKKKALSFITLDSITITSYIIWPKLDSWVRKNSFYFLSLIKRIKHVKAEDAEEYIRRASIISSFSLFEISDLFSFLVLLNEDGIVYSAKDDEAEGPALISSDFTIQVGGSSPALLLIFSEPLKIDRIKTFSVSKESILNAFSNGYSVRDIISFLESLSERVPEMLSERLKIWEEEYNRISIRRALILKADEKSSIVIKSLPQMKDYIIEEIAENLFIMDGIRENEWREVLKSASFDMLPDAKGPELNYSSFEEESSFIEYVPESEIRDERHIKYDPVYKEELLSLSEKAGGSLERAIWKAVINNGFLLRKDFISLPFPFKIRDAFNYQEKRALIEEALKDKSLVLFVENHRGKIALGKVQMAESFEEGDHMILSHKMLKISRLYRVCALSDDLL